jgi:fatty acid desaturase
MDGGCGGMLVWAWTALGVAGIGLRQVDRVRFARRRGDEARPTTVPAVLERQRSHANNVTPTLLLVGHWLEIAAWWGLGAALGPAFLVVAAVLVSVKFRHLQETSHFAAHGVLFRSLRTGDAVTDVAAHAPLGFAPVPTRRERHVRRHHPNAAVPGVDPNLDELVRAGIRPGASTPAFIAGVLFPLTPRGAADTMRGIAGNLRAGGWWRMFLFVAVPAAAYAVGDLPVLIAGYAIPRLLIYPQLAWMSLLVEHTWFDDVPNGDDAPDGKNVAAQKVETEAARCIRLYRARPFAELLARSLWLPYGDLYHFAHSAHPSVRWNYLRLVDELLGSPGRTAGHVIFGKDSVLASLRRVTAPNNAPRRPRVPARSPISA